MIPDHPRRVQLATWAMRCRFELVLFGEKPAYLRAAGEEAVAEIRALDRQLSYFSDGSDISLLNREAAQRPVKIEPRLFTLLQLCKEWWGVTEGAFDPTVTPIMNAWHSRDRQAQPPRPEELQTLRSSFGMNRIRFNPECRSVQFENAGLSLNLGAVGKGYALDRAAEVLSECAIESALLHAGTSSVKALGSPPGTSSWRIALALPEDHADSLTVGLSDCSLGVSGTHLRADTDGLDRHTHIIDPLRLRPVENPVLAAVVSRSAAKADAFSTALFCSGRDRTWGRRTQGALLVWKHRGETRTWKHEAAREAGRLWTWSSRGRIHGLN